MIKEKVLLNVSCRFCKKEFNTTWQGLNSHARACLKYREFNNMGLPPDNFSSNRHSNKGLNKFNSDQIRRQISTFKERVENGTLIPSFTNRNHSNETKLKISKKMSVNQKGGRCKWYEFEGHSLQGTWELEIAKKLSESHFIWNRIKLYTDSFEYNLEGKTRTYTPDFYVKELDSYLEIKGYWWGNDEAKMKEVIRSYPNKKFIIIETKLYKELIKLDSDKFRDKLYSLK